MKKTILIALGFSALSPSLHSQNTSLVAERFRSLINSKQAEWNTKINYSSTNKTNMKKTIISIMTTLIAGAAIAQSNTTDEQSARNVIAILEKGWNTKSGETFASVFADVHDYIVVNGYYFPGFTRQRNAATHQGLFNGVYKDTRVKLKVDKVQFFRADLAQITALGAQFHKDSTASADPAIIMTVIIEKKNNEWKIISFHNHNLESFIDRQRSPVPLEVMYASWYKN